MDYQEVTIRNINNGAVIELFEEEFRRVLENIADENTKADAVREIQIKIKIKPDEHRSNATSEVSCKSKLAPIKPHSSFIVFGHDGTNKKAYTTDPRQNELEFPQERVKGE